MPKYTPGPWEVDITMHTAINKQGKHIAMVNFYHGGDPLIDVKEGEHKANVALIAAAPEMLGILKRMVAYYDDIVPHAGAQFKIDQAKEIIAKAEGE